MAILDVLMSLARYAQNSEHPMCVPNVVYASGSQKVSGFIGAYWRLSLFLLSFSLSSKSKTDITHVGQRSIRQWISSQMILFLER